MAWRWFLAPGIGSVPLAMHQLIATCADVLLHVLDADLAHFIQQRLDAPQRSAADPPLHRWRILRAVFAGE